MERCKRCLAPEIIEGIDLDQKGVCNHCRNDYVDKANLKREENLKDLKNKIREAKESDSDYDCVLGLSGGSDSSYLLYLLSEKYGLDVFAVTVQNGFLPEVAIENARKLTNKLEVDHEIIELDGLSDLFKKILLERKNQNSTLLTHEACSKCHPMMWNQLLKVAIEKDIGLVFSGESLKDGLMGDKFSYELSPHDLECERLVPEGIRDFSFVSRELVRKYYLTSGQMKGEELPSLVFPYHALPYDKKKIEKKAVDLCLLPSNDSSHRVTNCSLSRLLAYVDFKRTGVYSLGEHRYFDVRNGNMSKLRAKAELSAVKTAVLSGLVWKEQKKFSLNKLGLSLEDLV